MVTSGFETGYDGWTTPTVHGDQPFTLATGSTSYNGAGPSSAAVGTGYIHAAASGYAYYYYGYYYYGYGQYNGYFDLEKTFPAGSELYGVAFQYHMFGDASGSLAVLETSADGTSWTSVWSKSGNLGYQWLQATLYSDPGQTMLRFTYVPQHSCPFCTY